MVDEDFENISTMEEKQKSKFKQGRSLQTFEIEVSDEDDYVARGSSSTVNTIADSRVEEFSRGSCDTTIHDTVCNSLTSPVGTDMVDADMIDDTLEENQTDNTSNYFDFEIMQNESNKDDSTLAVEELIIKKTLNYTCYICDQSIGSLFYTFLKHLILVHFRQNIIDHFQLQDNIVCPICKKKFSKKIS